MSEEPQKSAAKEEPERLEGVLERLIFHNPENGYTVARLIPDGDSSEVVAVGTLPSATPGEALLLTGKWVNDRVHGRQFHFTNHTPILPNTAIGMEKYLGSGLVKGIGPVLAKRLVKQFGTDTLNVLDQHPDRLREVPGIGPKRIGDIADAWGNQTAMRETMVFLQGIGVSVNYAARLAKEHGREAPRLVKRDPYGMLLPVRGLGFKRVDELAREMGIEGSAPVRLRAGIEHSLSQFTLEGHVCAPLGEVMEEAEHLLGVTRFELDEALSTLVNDQRVVLETEPDGRRVLYPKRLHLAEQSVAFRLAQLIETKQPLLAGKADAKLAAFEKDFQFQFADNQRDALLTALNGGVTVITGGPGTGKTTLLRALLRMLHGSEKRVLLCSPTGRAAKRMSQSAKQPALTIHRLLQYSPQEHKFQRNADHPLDAELVVIDEVSMLDLALAADLLEAIRPGTSLVMIGDVDQLPAVGAGNVLRDLIDSERVPVVRLNQIFRQAQRSAIVHNAHLVNEGSMPVFPKTDEQRDRSDMFFVEKSDPEAALEIVKQMVHERIPSRFGFETVRDIQVIAPMRRGALGVTNLNTELQALLNRDSNPLVRGGRTWKRGDKVMQVSNNYDKDVYNGDMGLICDIDAGEQTVKVRYDHRVVDYDFNELDEIDLAYAITIHKSQGSEFPAIVIPLHTQHHVMLQRNLLYTAMTRGRKLVVIVGSKQALARAVREVRQSQRLTGLRRRLCNLLD